MTRVCASGWACMAVHITLLAAVAKWRSPSRPPRGGDEAGSLADVRAMTERLCSRFAMTGSVTGFVNEGLSLISASEGSVRSSPLARLWRRPRQPLALAPQHQHVPLDVYTADILRASPILRQSSPLVERALRYYRHPFLVHRSDLDVKRNAEFLDRHGFEWLRSRSTNADYQYAALHTRLH